MKGRGRNQNKRPQGMSLRHLVEWELEQTYITREGTLDTNCWETDRSKLPSGYVQITFAGRHTTLSNLILEHTIGRRLKPHEQACHHCDNPGCIRPDHLFLGTQKDNLQDMRDKGRHSHGSRHKDAKLDERQVGQIKLLLRVGFFSYRSIAKRYGVNPSSIHYMNIGKTWKHVE